MAISGFKKLLEEAPKHSWMETGTAVFSFFNIVIISICAVIGAGFLVCLTLTHHLTQYVDPELWYPCLACSLGTVLAFVFAVLLYLGMYQKKPSFVLAYFIFGVVVVELSLVSILMTLKYYHVTWRTWNWYKVLRYDVLRYMPDQIDSSYSMVMGVIVVYAFVLGMVCRTYFWLTTHRSYHQRLLENSEKEGLSSPISTIAKY